MKTWICPTGRISKLFADMLNQPHLLIAGTTGSGKSVLLNGLIATALYRPPLDVPDGAQFILIDPKGDELEDYEDLPHTLFYSNTLSGHIKALQKATIIMEARNMLTRDRRKKDRSVSKIFSGSDLYVIIDEWFDLISASIKSEATTYIQRLAAKGRSARVHLIVCTQTPLAKVLPTEIRCNFDARVGLRTRDAGQSKLILDSAKIGLDKLPAHGYGYYMRPIENEEDTKKNGIFPIPYIRQEEINALIDWWMAQDGTPHEGQSA